jgi:uncharacterized repeat protein (TIGR01451 family)
VRSLALVGYRQDDTLGREHMRVWAGLVTVSLTAFLFAGCGGSEKEAAPEETTSEETAPEETAAQTTTAETTTAETVQAAGAAQAHVPSTSLIMTANPDSVAIGEPVTLTVTKTNNLPRAYAWQVRDFLPTGLEFVSATSSQGSCALNSAAELGIPPTDVNGSGVVQCDLGPMLSGESATMYITVIPTVTGEITSHAADTGENLASATIMVE